MLPVKSSGSVARSVPSPAYVLRGASSAVTAVDFTEPATGRLVSGGHDGHIHLWDLATRRIQADFHWHGGQPVLLVEAGAGAERIFTQGRDGFFNVWKHSGPQYVLDGQLTAEGPGFCSAVLLAQDQSSPLVAVPGPDSVIRIHALDSLALVQTLGSASLRKDLGLCMCMCAVPGQGSPTSRLLAGYENGKLILWDVGTGRILHQLAAHSDAVMCLTYSHQLNKGFSGSVDDELAVWRVRQDDTLETLRRIPCTNAGFNDVQLRGDHRLVATAGWDHQVRVFSTKSLQPLAVLAYHRESVSCVQFSQDHLLALGSRDQLISVWDIYRAH